MSSSPQLTKLSHDLIETLSEAIQWNDAAASTNHRVSIDQQDNYQFLLRSRLQARKLKASSMRPPCVGVFGPSQAGKSYLVSALSRPETGSLTVQFGSEAVDFLQSINPGGGRESTGVVTRFTLHPPLVGDDAFPVEARLLSESDVLKIICNSYFSDFDHAGSLQIKSLDADEMHRRLSALEKQAANGLESPALLPEDVLDLKQYIESTFDRLSTKLKTDFWPVALKIAAKLPLQQRAELFSMIWADVDIFTNLYLTLSSALTTMKSADVALVSVQAITASDGNISLVDAQLLAEIGRQDMATIQIVPVVQGEKQPPVSIPKPIVAALVAELRLPISHARWQFLNSLDMLDFPGARSRLKLSNVSLEPAEQQSQTAELFLRGKVAFLFERYTSDKELAAVLLCVPWGPQEVTGYAPLINHWVAEMNGATQDARAERPPGLFLVLTKFDMDLQAKGGDTEATERSRWPDRIRSSLLERFGGMDWVSAWDRLPFRNTFWLRNPEIKDSPYMAYDNGVETGIQPSQEARLTRLRDFFISDELVGQHFSDPADAWDAAMTPADGGIRRIVGGIEALSDPDLHTKLLLDRLSGLCAGFIDRLEQYFSSGQDEEVAKKAAAYKTVKNQMAMVVKAKEIWRFQDVFCPDAEELRDLYYATSQGVSAPALASDEVDAAEPESSDFDIDAFFEQEVSSASSGGEGKHSPVNNRARVFAEKAVAYWISHMRERAQDPTAAKVLMVSTHAIAILVEEFVVAIQRNELADRLAAALHPAESNSSVTWESIVDRQVTVTKSLMSDFLNQLGMSSLPLADRPGVPPDNPKRRVFEPYPAFLDSPPLQEVPINVPTLIALDWVVGLQKMFTDNAGFSGSDRLPAELNLALGGLIGRARDTVTAAEAN